MSKQKQATVQRRSVAFPVEQLKQIEKLAVKKNITASELIRSYVDKGIEIDDYIQDIFCCRIVHQEIKLQLAVPLECLVKILMKLNKISAVYYCLT